MIILLPWPDMSLMPNRKNGRHWGGTQAAKVRARQYGYYAAKSAFRTGIKLGAEIPLKITFFAPDRRHRDLDNLLACIKPHIDGGAQALGVDDKQFKPITIDAAYDSKKTGYVTVRVGHGGSVKTGSKL